MRVTRTHRLRVSISLLHFFFLFFSCLCLQIGNQPSIINKCMSVKSIELTWNLSIFAMLTKTFNDEMTLDECAYFAIYRIDIFKPIPFLLIWFWILSSLFLFFCMMKKVHRPLKASKSRVFQFYFYILLEGKTKKLEEDVSAG